MIKRQGRTALMILLLAVFLFSVGMMIRQQLQYRKIAADCAEAVQIARLPRPQPPAGEASAAEEEPAVPLPKEAAALTDINLEALQAVNKDVEGWIEIPGTDLSYPLMQGIDNQYYLSHNWKREASDGGAVFLEYTSSKDLTDFHTIVYAHRMRNNTMFSILEYYKELDFWQAHPSVYVVLDGGIYRYDIFSAQEAGVKGLVYRLDIEESQLEEEFLQYCTDNSVIDTGLIPEAGSRILTLSTCTGNGHATRWVVHGFLAQVYSRGASEG